MSKILCIHAHPDDAEILAGGTLALLAAGGHSITIVTMTPGDKGSDVHPPGEIAAIRRAEAAAAAALIGAEYRCAEFRDLAIFNDDASRRRVTQILRQVRPDLILTSAPADYLCDHEATSLLVRDACFAAMAPNYGVDEADPVPAIPAIPHLYFMDPLGGVDRDDNPVPPDFIVDVCTKFELKKEMLASHKSQRDWLLRHHGMDNYIQTMADWTRKCGAMAGFEYGEGFRLYKGHPYPQTPLLEDLLGPGLIFRRHRQNNPA